MASTYIGMRVNKDASKKIKEKESKKEKEEIK